MGRSHPRRGAERHAEGQRRRRELREEHGAPAEAAGEPSAGDRSERGGQGEAAGDPGLEASALARRHRFADDRHGEGVEPAAGSALQQPAGEEPAEGSGAGGDRAAGGVQAERDQQQPAAAERVAELAVDRRGDGGGDEIGDDHPGDAFHRAERPGDRGQRRGDDGLVDGADDDGGGHGREGAEEGGAQLRRGHSGGWPGGGVGECRAGSSGQGRAAAGLRHSGEVLVRAGARCWVGGPATSACDERETPFLRLLSRRAFVFGATLLRRPARRAPSSGSGCSNSAGVPIRFIEDGAGEAVILVHGYTSDAESAVGAERPLRRARRALPRDRHRRARPWRQRQAARSGRLRAGDGARPGAAHGPPRHRAGACGRLLDGRAHRGAALDRAAGALPVGDARRRRRAGSAGRRRTSGAWTWRRRRWTRGRSARRSSACGRADQPPPTEEQIRARSAEALAGQDPRALAAVRRSNPAQVIALERLAATARAGARRGRRRRSLPARLRAAAGGDAGAAARRGRGRARTARRRRGRNSRAPCWSSSRAGGPGAAAA